MPKNVVNALTPLFVRSAPLGRHADGGGLYLLVKSSGARSWVFRYSANGKVASLTNGRNFRTSYDYDGHDRLVKQRYPVFDMPGTSSMTDYDGFSYDVSGNVTQRRLRDNNLITYTYDNLDRLTRKDVPGIGSWDKDVDYTYDLLGRMLSATDSVLAHATLGYDALGRITSESSWFGAMTMQYDLAGRMTRLSWPDGFGIDYDRRVTGEVTAISEGATSLGTYAYDNLGRRSSLTRGNGYATTTQYDAVGRLTQLSNVSGVTGYDTVTWTYGYNPAGQIVSRATNNTSFDYTQLANRDTDEHPDGLDRLTSTSGPGGIGVVGYDPRGNLSGAAGISYDYSSENRLTSAGSTAMRHDPLGRLQLVLQSPAQTWFQYVGGTMATEYDASFTRTRRHVPGPGTDETLVSYDAGGTKQWYVTDERGSTVGVANAGGAITDRLSYDDYGVPATTNPGSVRFQYTGQAWLPEIGLQYSKARMYAPKLGRFMQTDPIGYAGGVNLYAYVGGDPVNRRDPWGMIDDEIVVRGKKPICSTGLLCEILDRDLLLDHGAQLATFLNVLANAGGAIVLFPTDEEKGRQEEENCRSDPLFREALSDPEFDRARRTAESASSKPDSDEVGFSYGDGIFQNTKASSIYSGNSNSVTTTNNSALRTAWALTQGMANVKIEVHTHSPVSKGSLQPGLSTGGRRQASDYNAAITKGMPVIVLSGGKTYCFNPKGG